MIARIRKLRASLTPEQEILRNRLLMGVPAGLGCYFFAFDAVIFAAFLTYFSFNTALYIMQKYGIWQPHERWFAAIILDVTMALAVMLREPEHMSIFYPLLLWITLGNGFRFGLKWLYVAAGLSTIAFAIVVATTPYWQPNQILGYSLTAALFIIPAYCSTLIRKISHAKEQAEIASRAKSYFLASVSHELRTPLNAIIGYGNHLQQSDMPRSQKEMIEASVLAGEHLLHLIEQLIEVAKSGTGTAEVKKSTFSPTELLTEIRAIMAVRAEEKGLALQLQAEPLSDRMINGPSDVLRNILLNLIGNAVKFTEAGTISISSGIKEHSGKHTVWFTVTDTGIGIANAAIDRIFQPFQQADDTVMNRFGGTGLGLAICKQLVEQVNGTISASSVIGQGSTFKVEVPIDLIAGQTTELEIKSDNIVRIISFGEVPPELLAGAQSLDNFVVQHVSCQTAADMITAISTVDLAHYNVALIAEHLAQQFDQYSPIWNRFVEAEVAPVLVKSSEAVDIEDVTLRAAFASILPPSPNFDELRSAIKIGCSFARQLRLPHADDIPAINITRSRKILVADDNRTNRNVLAAILETAGHEVTMATDGDEALEALEQSQFDILLLDINMPRLNGIDACAMWRQIEGSRQHLPIVGVTADATTETEQKCKNAGMDLRLTKPVDAKLLLATIERCCSGNDIATYQPTEVQRSDPLNVVVPLRGGSPELPHAIDAAQLEYLMSIGDANFVAGMIEGFFEDVDQIIQPLRQSVENSDVHEFRFCAHAFKSSGNNMGAKHLAALCGKLEKITEADFTEHRHAYLEKIEMELDRATRALKSPTIISNHNLAVNQQ
jgi:two-component system sensor histidine kinase RpfC